MTCRSKCCRLQSSTFGQFVPWKDWIAGLNCAHTHTNDDSVWFVEVARWNCCCWHVFLWHKQILCTSQDGRFFPLLTGLDTSQVVQDFFQHFMAPPNAWPSFQGPRSLRSASYILISHRKGRIHHLYHGDFFSPVESERFAFQQGQNAAAGCSVSQIWKHPLLAIQWPSENDHVT